MDTSESNEQQFKKTILDRLELKANEYGYNEGGKIITDFAKRRFLLMPDTLYPYFKNLEERGLLEGADKLELAKLILFLRSSKRNQLNLSSTAKGRTQQATIKNNITLEIFEIWANTMLDLEQEGFYQFLFEWKKKTKIIWEYKPILGVPSKKHCYYKEPYTDSELHTIIAYEKKSREKKEIFKSIKIKIGGRAVDIQRQFYNVGLFSNLGSKGGEGITKEFSFIYDCLEIMRDIEHNEEIETQKQKYDKIKYCIEAFYKANNKKESLIKENPTFF